MLAALSTSALMTSAGICLTAFPFFGVVVGFLSSGLDGTLQLMGSPVSVVGMSGGASGVGRFSSSL